MSISEKDAVLRERAAFERGVGELWIQEAIANTPQACRAYDEVFRRAAERYPLPKQKRPRVVHAKGNSYRLVEGTIEVKTSGEWKPSSIFQASEVHALADLLANPTEEVEA